LLNGELIALSDLTVFFSICIYNKDTREAWLVRDRLGIKPLYTYESDDIILFASEIKTILASGLVTSQIRESGLAEYLWFGSQAGTQTIYKNISKVQPGCFIHISQNSFNQYQYWSPEYNYIDVSEEEAAEQVRIKLEAAVKRQLISDVSIGLFLSGGIDSSAITAFASKHYGQPIHTYSVAFDYNRGNVSELAKAKMIADKFGTIHHELTITADHLSDVVDKLAYHFDEPFADAANIPLYLLTNKIKNEHKVVLQGDGGDELFGGYGYYKHVYRLKTYRTLASIYKIAHPLIHSLKPQLADRIKRFSDAVSEPEGYKLAAKLTMWDSLYDNPLAVLSEEYKREAGLHDIYTAHKEFNGGIDNNDILQLIQQNDLRIILPNDYLEKVDKSTMANSVEARVPFLDYDLMEYALKIPARIRIPGGHQKYILKKALRGIVPNEILDGPKRGFGVPAHDWIRQKLQPFFMEVMNDPKIKQSGLFDIKTIMKLNQEFLNGKEGNAALLWKTLNLALWHRHFMA
jgi:asparagine synthase (glutamine-hydrolysing)